MSGQLKRRWPQETRGGGRVLTVDCARWLHLAAQRIPPRKVGAHPIVHGRLDARYPRPEMAGRDVWAQERLSIRVKRLYLETALNQTYLDALITLYKILDVPKKSSPR